MIEQYAGWLGLPHVIGADPDDGKGADCVVMVCKVLEVARLRPPAIDQKWFDMARRGDVRGLKLEWFKAMEKCARQPFAVTMYCGPGSIGAGILVDDGVLRVHHIHGVQWVPLDFDRSRTFWRPRATPL